MKSLYLPFFLAFLPIAAALGDPRPFTFTYDTYPEGAGNWEYEQWVTWRTHSRDDAHFNRVDFRHEFEIGITDNFDLSIYLPNWRYQDTADHAGTRFDSLGVEAIVYLANPVTDLVGIGLYQEVNVGEHEIEFEQKLLVHKDIGNWTLAYNLILETEIEGVFTSDASADVEVEGVLGHAFGASYAVGPGGNFRAGAEAIVESVYSNWSHYQTTTVYAGPALSYSDGRHWWVALTPAIQLTDVDDEADLMLRMVAGIEF
jgi:hypothetical protein